MTPPVRPGPWRCDAALRALATRRLADFVLQPVDAERAATLRPCAVALVLLEAGACADADLVPAGPALDPLADPGHATPPDLPPAPTPDTAALLLTRRTGGLRRHAGQWALPGGRVDPGETLLQTALRELHEEVNLRLGPDDLLGRLDDYPTRSGYLITPLVFWGGAAPGLQGNPDEVASLHRIPIDEFMRDDAPMLETTDQGPHPVLRMPVGSTWIAAPTAAPLYQFREVVMAGRTTRVAHLDQPAFAWR